MNAIHRRYALAAAVTVSALAPVSAAIAAAPAAAATLSADKPCYVNADPSSGAPMTLTGSGYIPGDTVDISGGGVFTTALVQPDTTFVATTPAPILSTIGPGAMKTTLTATDENNAGSATTPPTATAVVHSANLAVSTSPGSVRNVRKDKVTFRFSGFAPHKNIFGYYMRKKIVAKVRFGKASGPCGTLRQRALLYPGGRPRYDRYTVTFESRGRYAKRAFPRVTGKLSILHF
ncbi:MAG TPA: hypothetical protein VFN87_09135 [Solirubrobacteraceae bacterium]|nr:hypothetical protein [Solirubrobacteraceae bacterium]